MLAELRLENYAVIDNVVIEFAPGLNLLTGETGAGKSILIDALGLLLGEKASSDVIRTGADRAVVAAVFESEGPAARAIEGILETNGLDGENGSLILRREIAGDVSVGNLPAVDHRHGKKGLVGVFLQRIKGLEAGVRGGIAGKRDDLVLLIPRDLRKHRQRQYPALVAMRVRKLLGAMLEPAIGG